MGDEPNKDTVPEYVHKAEEARTLAEAEKLKQDTLHTAALTKHADALTKQAEAAALASEINLRTLQKMELEESKRDRYFRIYNFTGTVTDDSVKDCMKELTLWSRLEPNCEITINFYSPGGDIVPGMALFDFLRQLSAEGHLITTVARGYVASMAAVLLQAGDHRVMGPEAYLLIHEGSGGAVGTMGEIEDTAEWLKKLRKRIADIFTTRSRLSKAEFGKSWKRKDWWLDSAEALKKGFVDEVR